jgi:predicted aspartyl protease
MILAGCIAAAAWQEVPIQVAGRVLLVNAMINGQGPFSLILDTGASETVLTPSVATQLGMKLRATSTTQKRGVVASLSVGGAELKGVSVYVFDPPQALPLRLNSGVNYHGILGYTFLSAFETSIDYAGRKAMFRPAVGKAAVIATAGGTVLPMEVRNNLIYVKGTVGGKGPLTLVVDTGSAEVLVTPAAAKAIGLRAEGATNQAGVGFARADVAIGSAVVSQVPCIIAIPGQDRYAAVTYHGILGTPFLSHFTVIFNYARKTVELLPSSAKHPGG